PASERSGPWCPFDGVDAGSARKRGEKAEDARACADVEDDRTRADRRRDAVMEAVRADIVGNEQSVHAGGVVKHHLLIMTVPEAQPPALGSHPRGAGHAP